MASKAPQPPPLTSSCTDGNEAEAMKIARALAEDEEAVQDDEDGDADVSVPPARVNGA